MSKRSKLPLLFALVPLLAIRALTAAPAAPALATEPEAPCANEQRRAEQPFASGLPDCRAYEMVSPLDKDDNGVVYIDSRAAVSGEAFTYFSLGSFADPKSAYLESRYLSRREATGWSTRNISPPFSAYKGFTGITAGAFGESLFKPDLSSGIVTSYFSPLVSGEPVGYINVYVADTEAGSYEAVSNVTPTTEYGPFSEIPQRSGAVQVEGASTDLSHVVFQQEASLCCGATPRNGNDGHVYEWAGGKLSLVDVPPEGVKLKGGKLEGYAEVGAAANLGSPITFGNPWRAVSADGSRVIFSDTEKAGETGTPEQQVYVRENPASGMEGCSVLGDACTVEVSASQKTNGTGPEGTDPNASKHPGAFYRDASSDGSRVFFTSRVELTNDANTGPEDNAANLYEYDFARPEGERLSDLTVDDSDPSGAAVLGLATASEDGSYVYLVAEGKLTSEPNTGGEEAVAGKPNLYLTHAGKVTFIATLAPSVHGYKENGGEDGDEQDWVGLEDIDFDFGPGKHTVRVTPDGTRLVFESVRELTGYDNRPAVPEACEEAEGCREVYLFDATAGKLVCASCDPGVGGRAPVRPVGDAELGGHDQGESGATSGYAPFYLPWNLSQDGGRLFFESPDPLVSHDSNGLLDVYEWEQPASPSETAGGENSCLLSSPEYSAGNGGCVFPISDVAGGYVSHFMDASPSGKDVFIATGDQLVPSDTDVREDAYDVRVDGGFPVSLPPVVCVNADSCKSPVSPQPGVFGVPASATFSGPGSATPAVASSPPVVGKPKTKTVRCKQPKKLTRGRCLKPKKKAKNAKKATRVGKRRMGGKK